MGSIIGIDVTGSPGPRKPLCAAVARLDGRRLRLERLEAWTDFGPFEAALAAPGPWLMALDTPFALPADARRDLAFVATLVQTALVDPPDGEHPRLAVVLSRLTSLDRRR